MSYEASFGSGPPWLDVAVGTPDDLRVVFADDAKDIRILLRATLRDLGIRDIVGAEDGMSAFQSLCTVGADVLITDWSMPRLSGLALAKLVRNHPKSINPFIPIVMLTARNKQEDVVKSRDNGVNLFVTKPLSRKAIRDRLAIAFKAFRPYIVTREFFGPDRRYRLKAAGMAINNRSFSPTSDFATDPIALKIEPETIVQSMGGRRVGMREPTQALDILRDTVKSARLRMHRPQLTALLRQVKDSSPAETSVLMEQVDEIARTIGGIHPSIAQVLGPLKTCQRGLAPEDPRGRRLLELHLQSLDRMLEPLACGDSKLVADVVDALEQATNALVSTNPAGQRSGGALVQKGQR